MIAVHSWSFNLILLGVILPLVSVLLIRLSKALNVSAEYVTMTGSHRPLFRFALRFTSS
jgi:hypothetical protein